MTVLHILYSGLGGHGNVFFSLAQADKKQEYKLKVIFNGIEDVRKEYIDRCEKSHIPFSFVKKKPGKHLFFFIKLLNQIRRTDTDIIFLHGSLMILPAMLAKIISFRKIKIIIRETQPIQLRSSKEKLGLKLAMYMADKIIFLSEEYKQEIKSSFKNRFKENKVAVIPNGIDLELFFPKNNRDSSVLNIGMQSRIVPRKDHKTLIESFALLLKKYPSNKTFLKIAGEGESLEDLKRLVEKLDIKPNVLFLGMLSEFSLPAFLNDLNFYIHASFGETMSNSIMQAMACRLPIIASDVKGINNMIINNKTGILIPVENINDLTDAMISLINNPIKAKEIKESAYNFAIANYSNITMFEKYSLEFKSLHNR